MRNFLAAPAARIGTHLRRAAHATVGHVSWQPPGWLRALTSILNRHRLRGALLLLTLAAAAFGGRYAYRHRRIPVPPRYVQAKIFAPTSPPSPTNSSSTL